jgi:hypothetical protein
MTREFQFKKGHGKRMINATQQLHNLGQNLWRGWHNPGLKPTAAMGTAVQAAGWETRTATSMSRSTFPKPMLANLRNELQRSPLQQPRKDRN